MKNKKSFVNIQIKKHDGNISWKNDVMDYAMRLYRTMLKSMVANLMLKSTIIEK